MLVLSTKPLQKLTGTDRQTGGLTNLGVGRHAPPKMSVAYDLVHYESLHPVGEKDIEETMNLVRSYTAEPSRYREEYGFTGNDISYLINPDNIPTSKDKLL